MDAARRAALYVGKIMKDWRVCLVERVVMVTICVFITVEAKDLFGRPET